MPATDAAVAGICIPLDVLLDTRIGTIARLGGADLVLQVLQGNYHQRHDDKFLNVDQEAYQHLYANRDEQTLSVSFSTNIEVYLRKLVHTLVQQALVRPFHQGVRVVVNTYPYQLSDEITSQIVVALGDKLIGDLGIKIPLQIVADHLPDQALTPEYCKQHFAAMFMYDYTPWLEVQKHALIKRPMPEVSLFAPAIYFVQTPTEEDLALSQTEFGMNPFQVIQKSLRGGIDLQLLPIELFSIIKPAT